MENAKETSSRNYIGDKSIQDFSNITRIKHSDDNIKMDRKEKVML